MSKCKFHSLHIFHWYYLSLHYEYQSRLHSSGASPESRMYFHRQDANIILVLCQTSKIIDEHDGTSGFYQNLGIMWVLRARNTEGLGVSSCPFLVAASLSLPTTWIQTCSPIASRFTCYTRQGKFRYRCSMRFHGIPQRYSILLHSQFFKNNRGTAKKRKKSSDF